MPIYLSPGVYVEEQPSGVQPIAGVGTSTAGFIGIVPDTLQIPRPNKKYDPTKKEESQPGPSPEGPKPPKPPAGSENKPFLLVPFPTPADFKAPDGQGTPATNMTPAGDVVLCTNFTEFKNAFGDFSTDEKHNQLAHAVYGFFNNGGRRCFVARVTNTSGIADVLQKFESYDEIALVAVPGVTDKAIRDAIVAHCKKTGDRFAILDSEKEVGKGDLPDWNQLTDATKIPPPSDYAAFYFPWIQVLDPATKIQNPTDTGFIWVPPSGHVAGIYARVDQERGVHKAPANEVIRGALDNRYYISKEHQDGLNPLGINCIRYLNGNVRIWGARTIGGDKNGEWKYINVRRTFLFLRESIDEGTQWVVFEPNTPSLWGKIVRNVTAFLTVVWRDGALFGNTPEEAFYVKCDSETNPPETRDLGQVVTEIGVAVAKPAEFVIFRISQWARTES